jgi:hypothetical protein
LIFLTLAFLDEAFQADTASEWQKFLATRRHGLSRDLWGLAVSLSKNGRLDLVFALVGATPLEYQHTSVAFLLAHSS